MGSANPYKLGWTPMVATPGALAAMDLNGQSPLDLMFRHLRGDWGDLTDEDKQANEDALREGLRILSAYTLANGTKVWVITEADRSVTTFLLPEEY